MSCVVHHYDKRAKQSKERREMRAESVATGEQIPTKREKRKKEKSESAPVTAPPAGEEAVESFSFAALQDEDAPAYRGPQVEEVEDEARPYSPLVDENALNERVLTGSASTRMPVWKSGLILGILAWVLFVLTFLGESLGGQQFIFNGLALLVGLGAVVWTAPSAFAKEEAGSTRRASRVAMGIGLSVLVLSALMLYGRMTG